MSDRTDTSCNDALRSDERVTTIRNAASKDRMSAESRDALDKALVSLAADAAETHRLRPLVDCGGTNCGTCQQCLTVNEWLLKRTVDAAVADRDRLTEALDLIGHGWDGDEFNDPADLVEEYASIARAALAGREGSDDA